MFGLLCYVVDNCMKMKIIVYFLIFKFILIFDSLMCIDVGKCYIIIIVMLSE